MEPNLEWWTDKWWHDPAFGLPWSPTELDNCVEILKGLLTKDWLTEALARKPPPTYARKILFGGHGLHIAAFIVEIARMLQRLKSADGIERKLKELLTEKHDSTDFELSIASLFADDGSSIRFPKESTQGKVPDIIVESGDEQIAVECKRLNEERWEKWSDQVMRQVMMSLPPGQPDDITFHVTLNDRLSEALLEDKFDDVNEWLTSLIGDEVQKAAIATLSKEPGELVEVSGLLVARRGRKSNGDQGVIEGVSISTTAKLRRIVRNGLLEALPQLPPDIPGLVAIYSFHVPDIHLLRMMFDAVCLARPAQTRMLAGLVLAPGGTIFEHPSHVLCVNKRSDIAHDSSFAIKSLRAKLKPREV